jgi:hypothetical protein
VIEANFVRLNDATKLPYIDELIARKLSGSEHGTLDDENFEFHQSEYTRLRADLESAYAASKLPEAAPAGAELNALLVRLRVGA